MEKQPDIQRELTVDVFRCARCKLDHGRVTFTRFGLFPTLWQPAQCVIPNRGVAVHQWTHWAPCPASGEPILLRLVVEQAEADHPQY